MIRKGAEIVDVECETLGATDKAIRVRSANTGREAWLPLSQVELHGPPDALTVVMPVWLAIEKEMI